MTTSRDHTADRALMTVDDVRANHAAPRSRLGRLFGVTVGDLEEASDRLVRTLEDFAERQQVAGGTAEEQRQPAWTEYPGSESDDSEPSRPTYGSARPVSPGDPDASSRILDVNFEDGAALRAHEVAAQVEDEQGFLFDDHPPPLPDDHDYGYSAPTAAMAAGVTYRQLDYWARTELVQPSFVQQVGSDVRKRYSFSDILFLKVIKRLLDAGISLQQIRTSIHHLRERGIDDLTRVTLMSDGQSVFECTSNDEVLDVLQGGIGVFGISIGGVWREIEGSITDMSREPDSLVAEKPAKEPDDRSLEGWVSLRQTLVHSLDVMEHLGPERQREVSGLLGDLNMSAQFRELEGVVDLNSERERRAARHSKSEDPDGQEPSRVDGD